MQLHRVIVREAEGPTRAGIVPFLADGRCLFMVSSNPEFGGKLPAIAKGRVDKGEDTKTAAIREGGEELGLRPDNMAAAPWLGWSGRLEGLKETYAIDVYAVLVKDADAFDAADRETERVEWLTQSEFTTRGRKTQVQIMNGIYGKIEAYLKNK